MKRKLKKKKVHGYTYGDRVELDTHDLVSRAIEGMELRRQQGIEVDDMIKDLKRKHGWKNQDLPPKM